MDLFNNVHIFEPMKVHTFEPNIRLIRLFSLMLNYAKARLVLAGTFSFRAFTLYYLISAMLMLLYRHFSSDANVFCYIQPCKLYGRAV